LNASAIEKHPASAAPMSSSGFVPLPLSKRDRNENGPSKAPLPSFMFPLPSLSVPSQTADPVRVAIVLISFVVDRDAGNRARKALADRIVCFTFTYRAHGRTQSVFA
jgi:hypothetical protein